jgi:hypothetical protein
MEITYWDKEKKDVKEIRIFAKDEEEKILMLQTFLMYSALSDKLKIIVPRPSITRDKTLTRRPNSQNLKSINNYL